jgi:hypothetical protein
VFRIVLIIVVCRTEKVSHYIGMNKEQKKKAFIKLFIKRLDEKQIREIHRVLNRTIENNSHVIDKTTKKKEN